MQQRGTLNEKSFKIFYSHTKIRIFRNGSFIHLSRKILVEPKT